MWQAFFSDWGLVFRGIAVFILVIVLMAAFFWALRRFGTRALGGAGGQRGRQPRLAVIETTMIDQRRQLWLVRRDNVEHLIMTGGPTDLVVEPNIVRGAAAAPAREPARVTPTLADALPRPLPLADGGNWPLQPEAPPRPQRAAAPPPAPKAFETEPEEPAEEWSPLEESERAPPPPRIEPALRAVPASRAESPRRPEPPLRAEPPARPEPPLRAEPELRPEPMLRAVPDPEPAPRTERAPRAARAQNSERLSGLASELSRSFMDPDLPAATSPQRAAAPPAPPAPPQPVQVQSTPPAPPAASVPPLSEAEEQNLTEMARSLESALARPRQNPTAAAEPPTTAAPPALRAVELPRIEPVRPESKPAPRPEPPPAPAPAKPAAKAAASSGAARPAFGTLEQEMASLLGRSAGKT